MFKRKQRLEIVGSQEFCSIWKAWVFENVRMFWSAKFTWLRKTQGLTLHLGITGSTFCSPGSWTETRARPLANLRESSRAGSRLGFHNLGARWGRAQLSEAATECEMENLMLALPPPLRKICREHRESLPQGNIPCLGDKVQEWLYFFGSKISSQSHAKKMSLVQIFCSAFLHVSGAQAWHFAHSGCAMNLFFFFDLCYFKDLEHYKMSFFRYHW